MVAAPAQQPHNPRVSVRPWNELEFAASRNEWQALLRRSSANPLFMSWEWQSRWWRAHHLALGAELCVLAAYGEDNRLVGLAPLYRREATHRWGLRAPRLELLGSAFRGPPDITFSEYLDFIVDTSYADAVIQVFAEWLLGDAAWADFVVANTRADGSIVRAVAGRLAEECMLRWQDPLTAHVLTLPESFDDYLHDLKPGIRRKVWNRRGRLNGPVLRFACEGEVEGILRQLRRFQALRWGSQPSLERSPGFHDGFAAAMARQGTLRMSVLEHGGEPISVLYNVELSGVQYNLQSGFSPAAAALSPSYLHFGYCLEEALIRGVRVLDFLGGNGRNRDYKQDFGARDVPLGTLQAIRAPALQRLYRLYDGAPQWMRRVFNLRRSPS